MTQRSNNNPLEPTDSSADADAPIQQDLNELEKVMAERDALFERLARATADYQNSRKRLEQDVEQRAQFANSTLIKALLPVIDNFERALAVEPNKADAGSILKGLGLVHDQLMAVLKAHNVEVIAPEHGTPFDPAHHQALMQQA